MRISAQKLDKGLFRALYLHYKSCYTRAQGFKRMNENSRTCCFSKNAEP
jgi:hypothetical protein